MSTPKNFDPSNTKDRTLNRRNVLLAGSTLAAAAAVGSASAVRVAQAQSSSRQHHRGAWPKPNGSPFEYH